MKKHNFITVIYSVLTKIQAWKITKDVSFEEYREKLFDYDRLMRREKLFEKITLPTLSLPCENTTVIIFTSTDLPPFFRGRLMKMIEPYQHIKIVNVDIDENVFAKIGTTVRGELELMGEDVLYSTVRLDDDDALAKNFLHYLDNYVDEKFIGTCITFSSGVGLIFEDGELVSVHSRKAPKIAIGLTWINKFNAADNSLEHNMASVYSLGNHVSVEERVPTLIDPREIVWARSIHDSSDIYSQSLVSTYKSGPVCDFSILGEKFDIKI